MLLAAVHVSILDITVHLGIPFVLGLFLNEGQRFRKRLNPCPFGSIFLTWGCFVFSFPPRRFIIKPSMSPRTSTLPHDLAGRVPGCFFLLRTIAKTLWLMKLE